VLALSANSAWALHANESAELPLAEAGGMSLSIKGSYLAVGGEAREYVYAGEARSYGQAPEYKVSELIWDITSLAMAGGTISAQLGEDLRINAGAWFAVNEGSGGMEDYDWIWQAPQSGDWTHFSESEVDIESAYSIDINASLGLFELGPFQVSGLLGYKHDFWEWSDFGGTYIYSTFGFRDDVGSFGGENGIDYEQTFDIPYVGIQLATEGASVRASGYFLYSPLVMAEDKDHHILRNLYFREEFEGGDFFAAGLDVSIDLTESIFIAGSVDAQVIPEFTGDMFVKTGPDGEEGTSPDGAGIENTVVAVGLSAGIRL
jgi:plasminogen activator